MQVSFTAHREFVGCVLNKSVGTFWEYRRGRKFCIKVDLQRETENYSKYWMKKCKEGNCRRHLSQGRLEYVRKLFSCKRVTLRCKPRCWVGTIPCTWAINHQSCPVKDALWLTAAGERDLATLSDICAMVEVSQPCLCNHLHSCLISDVLVSFWSEWDVGVRNYVQKCQQLTQFLERLQNVFA